MEANLCLSSSLLENSIQAINLQIYIYCYLSVSVYIHAHAFIIVHSFIWFFETVMAVLELTL